MPHSLNTHERLRSFRALRAVLLPVSFVAIVSSPCGAPIQAEVEPPSTHDARSYAMGGTGVALIDSGAAVYHNPANLMWIDAAAVTLSFSPSFNSTTQPLPADAMTRRRFRVSILNRPLRRSSLRVAASVYTNALSWGWGAYIFGGTGGTIPNFPGLMGDDLELQVGFGEIHLPVAVKITDELAVSAGLRMSFGFFSSAQLTPGGLVKQDLTGIGFPGAHVGVSYRPIPELRLGVNYRSAIRTTFSGDVTSQMGAADGELDFDLPHQVRVGGALSLLEDSLTLALDFRASFFESTNDFSTSRVTAMGITQEARIPLNWQNTYDLMFGVEYKVIPELALRAGYAIGNSSVPNESAAPFLPSPGILQSITFGVGTQLGDFELGAGGSYSFNGADVEQMTVTGGFPGSYSQRIWGLNVSATYRHPSS